MTIEQIALVTSVVLVVFFAIIAFSIIWLKARKMRKDLLSSRMETDQKGIDLILNRKDIGELFFDLKKMSKNPLDDLYVEFTINTIVRNDFKIGLYLGQTSGYEPLTFSNKAKMNFDLLKNNLDEFTYKNLLNARKDLIFKVTKLEKISLEKQYDVIIFNDDSKDLRDLYGNYFKNLRKNGLILIYDINKNKKIKKNLINHLKLVNGYFEEMKIGNGIFLITKR